MTPEQRASWQEALSTFSLVQLRQFIGMIAEAHSDPERERTVLLIVETLGIVLRAEYPDSFGAAPGSPDMSPEEFLSLLQEVLQSSA